MSTATRASRLTCAHCWREQLLPQGIVAAGFLRCPAFLQPFEAPPEDQRNHAQAQRLKDAANTIEVLAVDRHRAARGVGMRRGKRHVHLDPLPRQPCTMQRLGAI